MFDFLRPGKLKKNRVSDLAIRVGETMREAGRWEICFMSTLGVRIRDTKTGVSLTICDCSDGYRVVDEEVEVVDGKYLAEIWAEEIEKAAKEKSEAKKSHLLKAYE